MSASPNPTAFTICNIYGDHMVLQRGKPVRISGGAAPGLPVEGDFRGVHARTVADGGGRWLLEFPAGPEGGPFDLAVACPESAPVVFHDVLVGDVWYASGQSNMEFFVTCETYFYCLRDGREVAAAAHDDGLRLYQVPHGLAPEGPRDEAPPGGAWRPATTPEAVGNFSAVAYYFGKTLRGKLGPDVPIGIVNGSWGGTFIEPWIPRGAYEEAGRTGELRRLDDFLDPEKAAGRTSDGAGADDYQVPTTLYNAMVHPFTAANLRGVIWYQGCSNVGDPDGYRILQALQIESWRKAWRDPALPFLITQLSAYQAHCPEQRLPDDFWKAEEPGTSPGFAPFRRMQEEFLDYPGSGVACTIDIGDASDIHPPDKRDVGERLAHEAMRVSYGDASARPGPRFAWLRREGAKLRVGFTDAEGGLEARGGAFHPHLFAVAAETGPFAWAEARLEDDGTVLVWSDAVPSPARVQYAHTAYPPEANFFRKRDGLPVFPFQTK